MKILIVGSGGREHVLAWKIKQSPLVEKIYCAPGNGGISDIADCVDISVEDIEGLADFAKKNRIDLTVVGPEIPLVEGIVDAFEAKKLKIFGPNKQAANLEGSKVFAKGFMHKYNIPTAVYKGFNSPEDARKFLEEAQYPLVVKANGLAAGKGVMICKDKKESEKAIEDIMSSRIFKEAGDQIVIEEYLEGEEVSILAMCDGTHYLVLDTSQDHKRIFDDDLGPNTGGMGAYSPAPVVDENLRKQIEARIIEPTIRGMKREGIPFKGVLYAGLMITKDGPKVLEYNVRFGDPEAQVVIPRLKNDLVPVLLACVEERIDEFELHWDKRTAICVVMSSGGYPGEYKTGKEIKGLEEFNESEQTVVFHAGTKREGNKVLTSGGRVLGVCSFGNTIHEAIDTVYNDIEKISFERCFFRRDIGTKAFPYVGGSRKASTHR